VPVLHFFSGAHDEYHKPTDDAERINAAGGAQVAALVSDVTLALTGYAGKLTYQSVPSPPPEGDVRSFGASLGTVPDYAAAADGKPGVLLAGVRPGGPAEAAGLKRGDRIVKIGKHEIRTVEDLMFVLRNAKPGERTTITIERDGRRLDLEATYGKSQRR
jgi:S1-C subfamily serine protease